MHYPWSVGNEEWGIEWKESGTRIAATMREYCHRFDPTRLMTVASSSGPAILIPADVAGYNYILQNPVEQHRKDYPGRRALGSEETYGLWYARHLLRCPRQRPHGGAQPQAERT